MSGAYNSLRKSRHQVGLGFPVSILGYVCFRSNPNNAAATIRASLCEDIQAAIEAGKVAGLSVESLPSETLKLVSDMVTESTGHYWSGTEHPGYEISDD